MIRCRKVISSFFDNSWFTWIDARSNVCESAGFPRHTVMERQKYVRNIRTITLRRDTVGETGSGKHEYSVSMPRNCSGLRHGTGDSRYVRTGGFFNVDPTRRRMRLRPVADVRTVNHSFGNRKLHSTNSAIWCPSRLKVRCSLQKRIELNLRDCKRNDRRYYNTYVRRRLGWSVLTLLGVQLNKSICRIGTSFARHLPGGNRMSEDAKKLHFTSARGFLPLVNYASRIHMLRN